MQQQLHKKISVFYSLPWQSSSENVFLTIQFLGIPAFFPLPVFLSPQTLWDHLRLTNIWDSVARNSKKKHLIFKVDPPEVIWTTFQTVSWSWKVMRLKPLQTTSICGCLVLPGVQWLSHRLTSSLKFRTTAPESLSQKPSIQILPSAEFFICGFDYEVNLIVQKQTHNCNLKKWLGNLVPKNNENE